MSSLSIVWFRLDLRLADQPALAAALSQGAAVLPLFIHSPEEETPWSAGAASNWWLHQSLAALDARLCALGSRLILRRGPALATLLDVVKETGAQAVFWCRRYEPAVVARDTQIKTALRSAGIEATSFNGALLAEPWEVNNQSGKPFQVFTPFWKTLLRANEPAAPITAPAVINAPPRWPRSEPMAALNLLPRIPWYAQMAQTWQPGEAGASRQLDSFVTGALYNYTAGRNLPADAGTSRMSPHLHFGEISPRQVWRAVADAAQARGIATNEWRSWQYLAELGWREFGYHLLHHFPHTPSQPLRSQFEHFPWRDDAAQLRAWQAGLTGVPLVDAGMRELWATGWMHNRVRMVVASFLVKNLRLPWQSGARWFWDTLVDADLASNTLGWQWAAGCGADAAPYFRVFNPVSQGERFDVLGEYVRRWIPELADIDNKFVHAPWQSPQPPRGYPTPIVDLKESREAALLAWKGMRTVSGNA